MQRTFVIADTHFGHKKIIGFQAKERPFATIEEHDAELIDRWNSSVNKKDTVWHLGDVLFGAHSFDVLPKLNGIKKLVGGNHDKYPTARYLEHFNIMVGAAEYDGCILTHVPVHPEQLEKRFRLNIHGHLHSRKMDDMRYVCVSAEQTNLAPVLMKHIIERADAMIETYKQYDGD